MKLELFQRGVQGKGRKEKSQLWERILERLRVDVKGLTGFTNWGAPHAYDKGMDADDLMSVEQQETGFTKPYMMTLPNA